MKIFTIRDAKGSFHEPFYAESHGLAERTFKNWRDQENSQIGKYPEDFDLYYVGNYDKQTGTILALETPDHIIKAINLP